MDRRRFLEISGAVTAAALTGCGGGGSSSSSTPVTPTVPVDPSVPSSAEWQALAASMTGSLILPSSTEYDQARVVVNTRFDTVRPQAVARCKNAADIAAVLALVRKFDLAVTPRSGGHGFAGNSTTTGVVIDVAAMNSIVVHDDGTATIGAGARLAEVYDQLFSKGVAIPSGTCLTVGIAGITMGGGIGLVDRAYGLTCDNLIAAEVVTADGATLVCDATREPDLFWALRGGGGGNFGVVTSFTFKTHPTRDLANFRADFQFADAAKVITAWQDWIQTVPDTVWSYMALSFYNPTGYISLNGVCVGTEEEFMPYWTAFLTATNTTPILASVTMMSYRDTMMSFCAGLTVAECRIEGQSPEAQLRRYPFSSSSDFYNAPMPPAAIEAFIQGIRNGYAEGSTGFVLLDVMGGALGRIAPDATAFVHRDALFSAEYYVEAPIGTNSTWPNDMRITMKDWTSGGAYVNYMNLQLANWQTAYYGSNYAKLVQVKAKYDPTFVFHMAQGIPPA